MKSPASRAGRSTAAPGDKLQAPSLKLQAASNKRQATSLTGPELWDNMGIMKNKLKQINDELLIFYNRPGMALHFQPTNLKVLKNLITRLVELEDECELKKQKK